MNKSLWHVAGVAGLSTLLLVAALPAEAKLGGGRSYSGGSAMHSSSSRLGGGQSMGMRRDATMDRVRNPGSAPAAASTSSPAYAPPVAPAPQAPTAQRSGPGWGTVAAAAAVAGVAGYAMANDGERHQTPATNGNAANGGWQDSAASKPAAQSGTSWLTWLLLLGGLGALGYWLANRQSRTIATAGAGSAPASAPYARTVADPVDAAPLSSLAEQNLKALAESRFRELQDANNASDLSRIQHLCTSEMVEALKPYLGGQTRVLSLSWEIVEANNEVASIRYRGQLQEGDGPAEALDEVWHDVRVASDWLLAGIEQV